MKRTTKWLLGPALLAAVSFLVLPQGARSGEKRTFVDVLREPGIWDKAFPAALSSVPAWHHVGEAEIALTPQGILGARAFDTHQDAERAMRELRTALATRNAGTSPSFSGVIGQRDLALARAFQLEVVKDEGGYFHLSLSTSSHGAVLKGELTVAQIEQFLGKAENLVDRLIQTREDWRPPSRVLHVYADGAIAFAESRLPDGQIVIDRVLIKIPALMGKVFNGGIGNEDE